MRSRVPTLDHRHGALRFAAGEGRFALAAVMGLMLGIAIAGCSRANPDLAPGGNGGGNGNGNGGGNGNGNGGGGGSGVGGNGGGTGGGGGGGVGSGGGGDDGGGGGVTPTSCSGKSTQPVDGSWTIALGGSSRTVEVHVPTTYDPTRPIPLVINFHGYTSDGMQQAVLTGFSTKADASNFVVAYPEGSGNPTSFNGGACCGDAARNMVDDIGFTRAIIDTAADKLCIDEKRVFVTGFSNGGFMAHRIACELADRVAAVAPVSGVLGIPVEKCISARAISVLDFHGQKDGTVPYDGSMQRGWPAAPDTFMGWAMRDHCSDGAPAITYMKSDVSCATYSQCDDGVAVTLCTISDGGHAWPGSSIPLPGTTQNINATDAIWTFFTRHPLP
jgi:polyhydroxybutyrate depolymerase